MLPLWNANNETLLETISDSKDFTDLKKLNQAKKKNFFFKFSKNSPLLNKFHHHV